MSLVGSRVLGSVNKLLSLSLSTTATKPCAAVLWVKSVTWSLRGISEAGVYHEVPETPQVQALRLDLGTTSGSHAFARFCVLVKRKQLGNLSPEDTLTDSSLRRMTRQGHTGTMLMRTIFNQ
jgi:hypothetical protein